MSKTNKNSDNNNNNGNNSNQQLICGKNFQKAIKSLMNAHSNDLLEIENEFQNQRTTWELEKNSMIDLINKLKFKNQSLKSILTQYKQQILQYKQQQQQNDTSITSNNNSIDHENISSTDNTPIRSPYGSTTTTTTTSNPFVHNLNKLSPITNNNNNKDKDNTTTTTATTPSINNSTKKRKKKQIEEEERELDELDLPLVQDKKYDEIIIDDNEIPKLDFSGGNDNNNNNTPISSSQRIMNKYANLNNSTQSSPLSQQQQQSPLSQQQGNKKKIKIKEVIRNKEEREKLQGFDCDHCKQFYDAVLGDDDVKKKQMLDQCSRHRHSDEPPSTPPGFWNFGFPDSPMKTTTTTTSSSSSSSSNNNTTTTTSTTTTTNNFNNINDDDIFDGE